MLRTAGRSLGFRLTTFRALSTEKPKPPKKTKEEIMKEKTPPGKLDEVIGGPAGPEPTRYGDWERKGRVTDF
ncbi:hypothetical protein OSTOST_06390 [Ostertagia ostertagi]